MTPRRNCRWLAGLDVARGAERSGCGRYRYTLWRTWDPAGPSALFVGLNPSTADAERDDHTLCCCVRLAREWGCGGVLVGNLSAFRSTDPAALRDAADPVGPENDHWLSALAREAAARPDSVLVAAWGATVRDPARESTVLAIFRATGRAVECLGTTASGAPRHPSRLRAGTGRARFAA